MTANELQSAIGSAVYFVSGDIKFSCWVKDVRYANPRFLIEPIAGQGSRWVELSSLEPIPGVYKDPGKWPRPTIPVNETTQIQREVKRK